MRTAQYQDKELVVAILSNCFDDNRSVNYLIRQDTNRQARIRRLMEYAFKVCHRFGMVLLSDDSKACALLLLPEKKRTTLRSFLWEVTLVATCIGISHVNKAWRRERKIKALQPRERVYYLWFIGVEPGEQNKGMGTRLLEEVMTLARSRQRTICLETSTAKNLSWYQRHGFSIYHELDLGYTLYFLKTET